MTIESITREVFEGAGNAQEKMLRIYGKELNYSNAKKYLAGIKLHLETTGRLDKNKLEFSSQETSFNADQSQTVKQDVYLTPDEAADPVKIMRRMGFDPLLWEVKTCKVVSGSWDVTTKNKEWEAEKHTNRKYSITLTVVPLGGKLTFPQVKRAFEELAPVEVAEYDYEPTSETMLELPIMDFHLGKLAWSDETRQGDYDLKIAECLWRETVIDLLQKAQAIAIPVLIVFPVGQDFFHFDTPTVTTTAGTQLDSDTRWQKMFRKGVELLVWAVEQCRAIAPVSVMWIPGNHDQMLSYAATVGLAQRYANTDSVVVDLSPTPRKYFLFGKNLIGFAHGENEGKRIEGLMQIEAPVLWSESVWREMHMGHYHSESSFTSNGIVFRWISAVTASDAWHVEKGFVGSTRQSQAFVWDKSHGLQAILNSNVVTH